MKIAEIIGEEGDWPDEIDQEPPVIQKSPQEIGRIAQRLRNAPLVKPVITPGQRRAWENYRFVALGQRLAAEMAEPSRDQ